MSGQKNSHCSYCGHPYGENLVWPRKCGACGRLSFQNPLPVAVILLPVAAGLLLIRRGIAPQIGMLALPGGYIDIGESWQEAAVRELYEETGITVPAGEVEDFRVLSAPDGSILIFGLVNKIREEATLPPFVPTVETTERLIITAPTALAFALHERAVAEFFARKH